MMNLLCAGLGNIGNFVDVVNRNEGGGVGFGEETHQRGVLLLVDDDNDLLDGGVMISAGGFVDSSTAVKVGNHEVADLVQLGREDADAALDIVAEDEVVEDDAVEVSAKNAQHHDS